MHLTDKLFLFPSTYYWYYMLPLLLVPVVLLPTPAPPIPHSFSLQVASFGKDCHAFHQNPIKLSHLSPLYHLVCLSHLTCTHPPPFTANKTIMPRRYKRRIVFGDGSDEEEAAPHTDTLSLEYLQWRVGQKRSCTMAFNDDEYDNFLKNYQNSKNSGISASIPIPSFGVATSTTHNSPDQEPDFPMADDPAFDSPIPIPGQLPIPLVLLTQEDWNTNGTMGTPPKHGPPPGC